MNPVDLETAARTGAITGSGAPAQWELLADATAPSKRKGLAQPTTHRASYRFPLATCGSPVAAEGRVPGGGDVERGEGDGRSAGPRAAREAAPRPRVTRTCRQV